MAKKSNPDYSTRIQPGEKRNPKGRPRKDKAATTGSAYDILADRKFTVTLGGVARELSTEEGLQQRALQAAFARDRVAMRTVLKWIRKREKARPPGQRNLPIFKMEYSTPMPVDEALVVLGIASDVQHCDRSDRERFLELQPWAATSALSRPRRNRLSRAEIVEVKRCTREADSIFWPLGDDG